VTFLQSWVTIARLVRPQGRNGEILADILTDFPERFATTRNAFVQHAEQQEPTPVEIERSWLHKSRIVLKFAHIDSISAAEELRGAELVIPASERIALDKDTAYIGDLIGCSVVDLSFSVPARIGRIRDVIQQEKTADLLVVAGDDGEEHRIPFAKAYLVRVDLKNRSIEMNLPPGMMEINAPLTDEERGGRLDQPASKGEI
jgi:16S rRNA processing protein RimM